MTTGDPDALARIVKAVHGVRETAADPDFELGLANYLVASYSRAALIDLWPRVEAGEGPLEGCLRRIIWRAIARHFGHGVRIGSHVGFRHLETFEIGNAVFIGAHAYLQGRFDGRFVIGNHVWIGPQSYFDARDLILGDHVGWGPGAKVLGSTHVALPIDIPIIQTDLEIKPVRVDPWADIGTGAILLPGITVGRGSIVGAGAVVTHDVAPFSIVAGVPARFVRWRPQSPDQRVESPPYEPGSASGSAD